jgi:hypothetical protein
MAVSSMRNRWNGDFVDCFASRSDAKFVEAFRLFICFLQKGCEVGPGFWGSLIFSSKTCTGSGRVERRGQLRGEGAKTTRHFEAAIFGCFWHHSHMFLPECCVDFFLCRAYPNYVHNATQGAQKQLKLWSIAFHVRKKSVT